MHRINIQINRLRVSSFSIQDGSVTIDIDFDDGKEKRVYRTTVFRRDVENIAASIIDEIKRMEKNIHYEVGDDRLLQSHVDVSVTDEYAATERMIGFLNKVRDQIVRIKTAKVADGYIDMVRRLQEMKIEIRGCRD